MDPFASSPPHTSRGPAPQASQWLSSGLSPVCQSLSQTGGPRLDTGTTAPTSQGLSRGSNHHPDCHGQYTTLSFQLPLLWLRKTPEQQSCWPSYEMSRCLFYVCSFQLLKTFNVCVAKVNLNAMYRIYIFGWSERWKEYWLLRGSVSLNHLWSIFYLTKKTEKAQNIFRWLGLFLQVFALMLLLNIMVTSSPCTQCACVFS